MNPQEPTTQVQESLKSLPETDKQYHLLGPIIVFILCTVLFISAAFLSTLPIKGLFIAGAVGISLVVTGTFSLIAWVIRKIARKFGKIWTFLLWSLVLTMPFGVLGYIFLYKNLPTEFPGFFTESYYESPLIDWKTYINEQFDLSLRFPAGLKLDEIPAAYGFDDVFAVYLRPIDDSYSIIIYATTDQKKCNDMIYNVSYMPATDYRKTKIINNTKFLVTSGLLSTAYGKLDTFNYLQTTPVCKVAILSYATPSSGQADYLSGLKITESVIGSMDTDIKDTGSSDIVRTGESEYALSVEVARINAARGAAFRVYNYNPDNTPKETKSYIGTCTDVTFKVINPDMTCRESVQEFIMYFKMDNRYGYACGDKDWYGIVAVEPKGLSCGGSTPITGM